MKVYSFYVFNRHCHPVYYQEWNQARPKKPFPPGHTHLDWISPLLNRARHTDAASPALRPSSLRQITPAPAQRTTCAATSSQKTPGERSLIDSLISLNSSSAAHHRLRSPAMATSDSPASSPLPLHPQPPPVNLAGLALDDVEDGRLSFDEQSKLVFGVVYSLKNLVSKLSLPGHLNRGDEALKSYSTSAYKLHLFRSPTQFYFVLLTSPTEKSLRYELKRIWAGPWLDFVVRNPLVDLDSRRSNRGIDNEMFRRSVDSIIRNLNPN